MGRHILVLAALLLVGMPLLAVPAEKQGVKEQAAALVVTARTQIEAVGLPWKPEHVELYTRALEEAFIECVKKPLDKESLAAFEFSHHDWLHYNVQESVEKFSRTTEALRHAVCVYRKRSPTSTSTQKKLDAQIDRMVEILGAALKHAYPGQDEVINAELEKIRTELKRDSRNVIFPSMKNVVAEKELSRFLKGIPKAVEEANESYKQGTLEVNPALANAWSTVVSYADFCAAPPAKGKVLSFIGGPKSNGIRMEVMLVSDEEFDLGE